MKKKQEFEHVSKFWDDTEDRYRYTNYHGYYGGIYDTREEALRDELIGLGIIKPSKLTS